MEEIHHELKLDLHWKGAPQPAETIKCAASACEEEIKAVDPAVFSYFKNAALELIAVMGAEKALCAALAKLSGDNSNLTLSSLCSSLFSFFIFLIFFHKLKTKYELFFQFIATLFVVELSIFRFRFITTLCCLSTDIKKITQFIQIACSILLRCIK